jgi:hypothetical protein
MRPTLAHFDTAFLAQVSPAVLNQALQAVVSLRLLSIRVSELGTVVADVTIGDPGPQAQVFSRRRPPGTDQLAEDQPGPGRAVARHLGRRRCRPPVGRPAGPAARRRRHRRLMPAGPRPGPRHPGAARRGSQAVRARRAGPGRGRGQGRLEPAADHHRAAQEPAPPENSRTSRTAPGSPCWTRPRP